MKRNKRAELITLAVCIIITIVSFILMQVKSIDNSERTSALIVGLVIIFMPYYIRLLFKLQASSLFVIIYYIFVIMAMVLGSGWRLYDTFKFYDTILHFAGGILWSFVAYSLIFVIQKDTKFSFLMIFFFTVGFGTLMGVAWEIIEYICDVTMGMNMQIYASVPDRIPLIGQAALRDTMFDLIANLAGSIISGIALALYNKKTSGVPDLISIKKIVREK